MDPANLITIREGFLRLRGDPMQALDASIIIPVNARADSDLVLKPIGDILRYTGNHTIEIILVINNYPSDQPPPEISQFRELGAQVVAVPSARRPGEAVWTSARVLGARAANSAVTIHMDSDCRVPDINALLDWYIPAFKSGARLAYTRVGFHDLRDLRSVRAKIAVHHAARWVKRELLGIPTARGSNYAIDRSLFLQLYDVGKLHDDIQIGMAAKLAGARIAYSGRPELTVLTSGRRFHGGWLKLIRYARYRLRYNLKAIPTRRGELASWEVFDRVSNRREIEPVTREERTMASRR